MKKLNPLNDTKLTAYERLTMNYILRGKLRNKYIPRDKIAKDLGISAGAITNALNGLAEKGYILYYKPDGKKYRLIMVFNWTFLRYDYQDIKENKITGDIVFNDIWIKQREEMGTGAQPELIKLFNKVVYNK